MAAVSAIISLGDPGCVLVALPAGVELQRGALCLCRYREVTELGMARVVGEAAAAAEKLRTADFVRLATEADVAQAKQLARLASDGLKTLAVESAGSPQRVRPVSARFSFDRRRLTLVYRAEGPYDGRRLIALLQRRYNTQVELRQVGVRDAAARLGGLGDCGRLLCCATWIKDFQAVNVRMAKTQELALNPTTTNGLCSRLKCCLRYEFDHYRQSAAALPPTGAKVTLPTGDVGRVQMRDLLRGRLTVRTAEGRVVKAAAKEVQFQTTAKSGEVAGDEATGEAGDDEVHQGD